MLIFFMFIFFIFLEEKFLGGVNKFILYAYIDSKLNANQEDFAPKILRSHFV